MRLGSVPHEVIEAQQGRTCRLSVLYRRRASAIVESKLESESWVPVVAMIRARGEYETGGNKMVQRRVRVQVRGVRCEMREMGTGLD